MDGVQFGLPPPTDWSRVSAPQNEYVTVEGGAEYLNVSVRTVYRLIADAEVDLRLYQIQGMSRKNRRLKITELAALLQLEGDR